MPCSCFGKKDNSKKLASDVPYSKGLIKPADEGDFVKNKHCGGYLATEGDAKRESYLNGSSVSKSNTPSTVPAVDGSPQSSLSGSPSASPRSYRGALLRSELAEKRREFFRDYFVVEEGKLEHRSSATLPAPGRSRNFGDTRLPLRPVSQPSSLAPSPIPPAPPGPHLLRPVSPQTKIVTETFASPIFLNELRTASEEISRRWQMPDDERNATPCSLKGKVRVFPVTNVDRTYSTEGVPTSDFPEVNTDMEKFPELNFDTEYPYTDNNNHELLLDLRTPSPKVKVGTESPEIGIITQSQFIGIETQSPDISSAGSPDIRIESPGIDINNTDMRNVIVNEEFITITQKTSMPLDEQIAVVGSVTSSDSALNFPPPERGHQTPSPGNDAAPRIVEPHDNDAQIVTQPAEAVSFDTNAPSDSSADCFTNDSQSNNIPPQQELGRTLEEELAQPAGDEEVNVSFSSDELADHDIPHQAWQEDEVRPLLDEDDGPTTSIHDTSPNLINN